MSAEKKMTVQEMALGLASDVFGDVDYYSRMGKMPLGAVDRVAEQIKQALLSYAAQEVEEATRPLVEALSELIKEVRDMVPVFEKYGMDTTATACAMEAEVAEQALTAHLAKHGRKGQ